MSGAEALGTGRVDRAAKAAPPGNADARRIRAQQIRLVYRNTPAILIASTVCCLLVGAVLWNVVSPVSILIWVGLMLGVSLARVFLVIAFRRFALSISVE